MGESQQLESRNLQVPLKHDRKVVPWKNKKGENKREMLLFVDSRWGIPGR